MSKILFIYPNEEGYPIIPLGISTLSALLKNKGHEVLLFDTTFMVNHRIDNEAREKTKQVKDVDVTEYWGKDKLDIDKCFVDCLKDNNPDIIAFSVIENNYGTTKRLLGLINNSKIITLIGGLFPTVAPHMFKCLDRVDIICIGEGEKAIVELADKIDLGVSIDTINNLIVKKDNYFITNKLGTYYDWNPYIDSDWTLFDNRHIDKPFMGKMYRTGFFEISRGCPFACSYCINKKCQEVFKNLGNYHRQKPLDLSVSEIKIKKDKYGLELIFFNDENFFSISKERFNEFKKIYEDNVGLPFFLMSRATSFTDEIIVSKLKEMGCITIGIGIEHGNEKIRNGLMNKKISNDVYKKAFANCRKYGIRTTANIMIGMPFETEDNIMESVEFCKAIEPDSLSISIFAPYYGTKLRDVCVSNGFMEDRYYDNISVNTDSILSMPQLPKERIKYFYYNFIDMVYGGKEK